MSFRNTGILLVVLLVLSGVVFWVNRPGGAATDTDATPTPAPLTALSASDIAAIRIERGDQSITIERQDEGWVITGDPPGPAGEDKVTQALDRLIGLRPTRSLTDVQNVADFGLDEPAWIITLKPSAGDAIVFRVGDENPQGTARYLQVPGDPVVHLVPKFSVEEVEQWLDEPPYPPTPTPELTETPAEVAEPTAVSVETPEPTELPAPAASPTAPAEPTAGPTETPAAVETPGPEVTETLAATATP